MTAHSTIVRPGVGVWRYVAGIAFLGLMLALTWGMRAWWIQHVADTARQRQAQAASAAQTRIARQFDRMQQELVAEAVALAGTPAVIEGLRAQNRGAGTAAMEPLVQFFTTLSLPERDAVELYSPRLRLLAWKGFSMPMDGVPRSPRFPREMHTAVAHDGSIRQALVVWWPVQDGQAVLGVVRVMRYLRFWMPVRNRYLRDFDIADVWERAVGLPVRVWFAGSPEAERASDLPGRLLQGNDGRMLGEVVVEPPSVEYLLEEARMRFEHVEAFWGTLLLFWLFAGLWSWYRRALARALCPAGTPHPGPLLGRFVLVSAAWWGLRYALLALAVPGRWQRAKAPLAPLFDPVHLASTAGGGLMRSMGDLLVTALFALLFALAFVDLVVRWRRRAEDLRRLQEGLLRGHGARPSALRFFAIPVGAGVGLYGLALVLAETARHVVLDSTLDYFARSSFLPDRLVLVVFCILLLVTVAAVLLATGLTWASLRVMARYRPPGWPTGALLGGVVAALLLPLAGFYAWQGPQQAVPGVGAAAFLLAGFGLGVFGLARLGHWMEWLTLRSVLPAIFVLTVLLYPLLEAGLDAQRRTQMLDAASLFEQGSDPRALFALEQVLREAQDEPRARAVLQDSLAPPARLDSLAAALLRASLLSSLSTYDVGLAFFDAAGRPVGQHHETEQASVAVGEPADEFELLRQMYAERGTSGILVQPVTGVRERERFQYKGIVPLYADGLTPIGWAVARAEPQTQPREGTTPFPLVLLPSYSNAFADLSVAEFRDGVLARSLGRDFGRYRLAEEVRQDLITKPELWRTETVQGRQYRTYYRRQEIPPPEGAGLQGLLPVSISVIAVRIAAINTFDHLYYLLRLTVSGVFLGLPLYLLGLHLRRRAGLLPAPRVRFRDRVLNAFFAVGILSVAAVGFVGLQVVTGESERAIQAWLEQHLERAEELLALDARGDELPYRVLDRITDDRAAIDSLAAQVGLDFNVYRDRRLVASSRPQLIQNRLLDERLPVAAYQDLYFDGYRFTYTDERVGSLTYTAGFRALPDEQGRPRYVISVPTLPEQERIEEERARTVAYLFGALLLLVLVVMLTASILANALTRPIGRLRAGLEAVARGRFDRAIPVETRDEVGDLVRTFNEMQQQLAESRRKLAQQERQLAWREMARQVAHEIKNPLTPMKLSVQHLRRAYDDLPSASLNGSGEVKRFSGLFDRITSTLVEQIDTLARIANEFSSFARMPTQVLERLDLNAVVQEAVALMQEEAEAEITLTLSESPLVLEADHEELRRIFINLIKNALQAAPADRMVSVEVATARLPGSEGQPAWALCTVADSGSGIPPALRRKIFEPNFSTKTSGTGLGLAIVKKGVEDLRGKIGFETEEGVGTTFTIRLPLAEEG